MNGAQQPPSGPSRASGIPPPQYISLVTQAQKVKEVYIAQRTNLWLSRCQELTPLEAMFKADSDSPLPTKPISFPEMNKSFCSSSSSLKFCPGFSSGFSPPGPCSSGQQIPVTPFLLLPNRKGNYFYIPRDDTLETAPTHIQEQIKWMDAWARNPCLLGLMKQVDGLLDQEILKRARPQQGITAEKLKGFRFTRKVHLVTLFRLLDKPLIPQFPNLINNPKFRFVAADIDIYGTPRLAWHFLDWNCSYFDLKSVLYHHSFSAASSGTSTASSYTPRESLPKQIERLERVSVPHENLMWARELILDLKTMVLTEGDKMIREGEAELAVAWISSRESNGQGALGGDSGMMGGGRGIGGTGNKFVSGWSDIQRYEEFLAVKERAYQGHNTSDQANFGGGGGEGQGQGHIWPIFMQPWQLRFYNITRRVRQLCDTQARYLAEIEGRMGAGAGTAGAAPSAASASGSGTITATPTCKDI